MSTNAIKTLLEKQLHAYQGFLSGKQCDLSAFCESCAEKQLIQTEEWLNLVIKVYL